MKMHTATCILVSSVLLATASPAFAKNVKYTAEEIGAEKTCRNDDEATPVDKCIKKFAENFCEDKGHKTYVAANWSSSADGYSVATLIYCGD